MICNPSSQDTVSPNFDRQNYLPKSLHCRNRLLFSHTIRDATVCTYPNCQRLTYISNHFFRRACRCIFPSGRCCMYFFPCAYSSWRKCRGGKRCNISVCLGRVLLAFRKTSVILYKQNRRWRTCWYKNRGGMFYNHNYRTAGTLRCRNNNCCHLCRDSQRQLRGQTSMQGHIGNTSAGSTALGNLQFTVVSRSVDWMIGCEAF